jgi:threonine aldolase
MHIPHIELRSDTFTKPTKLMMEAMMNAQVGDDVFEEDPTTNALESKCASMFGYQAALFCMSGTMANQIAIKVHTQPADEVICDELSHIYLYEGGGMSTNSLVSAQLLKGDRGRISAEQITQVIKADNVHYPISKLVSLENTVNKGGGCFYTMDAMQQIKNVCTQHQLGLHLDGARLMNAIVASGQTTLQFGEIFDSISVCLSKGLGAPMGSVLLGSHAFIKAARRVRKRMGGGWRQSGFLAAAGAYALDHHVARLVQDHDRAKELATLFSKLPMVQSVLPVDTNIVIMQLHDTHLADSFVQTLDSKGIHASPFGKHQVRLVTHLDFTDDDLQQCKTILQQLL